MPVRLHLSWGHQFFRKWHVIPKCFQIKVQKVLKVCGDLKSPQAHSMVQVKLKKISSNTSKRDTELFNMIS